MGVGHFGSPERRSEFLTAYRSAMAELPPPQREFDVNTAFGSVHAYRFGTHEGTPVVLLPGRTGTSAMWEPNVAALTERYSVYAVDVLGEPGLSVQTVPIRRATDQACWLGEALAALDLGRVHLVGASFGGWLALNLAIHAPERLTSVSVLDPARTLAGLSWRMVVGAFSALPIAPKSARDRFLSWLSGGEVPKDDPLARLIDAGMRGYQISQPVPAYPSDEQLRAITLPVLALIGGRSTIHNPRKAAERGRRLLPNAEVELWPHAGHGISAECAEAVNARLLEFLDRLPATEAS